jgi:hypothetical protein
MKRWLLIIMSMVVATPAFAECDLDQVVGYTLIAAKTVDAYIEHDEKKDGFEGCNFGRIIVFRDGTGVACSSYGYSYAYAPTAYIFANGALLKMCVEGEWYDVRRLP